MFGIGPTYDFLPNKHKGEGLLPWVIAVMIFLSALCLVITIAIGRGLDNWSESLTTHVSIQIVESNKAKRDRDTARALSLINATPGVETATVLADSDMLSLLKPWLGDIPSEADLPVPTMIDVKLADTNPVVINSIKARLKTGVPSARVDDHQAWMGRIINLAAMARLVLAATVILVFLCTIAIVIFGCRAGLTTHRKNIEIMHMIGAEDHIIARSFERKYLWHGLFGGITGVMLAGGSLYGLITLAEKLGEGLMTSVVPDQNDMGFLVILPLIAALLTMSTAGITVRSALKKMM